MTRRGFTLAEIAVAVGVLALLGIPVMSLLTAGTREAIASQDNVEAEIHCSRLVEEKLAASWKELTEKLPLEETVTEREYTLKRTVRKLRRDLLAIEVVATWKAQGRDRRYAVLRLLSRETLSAGGRVVE